MNPYIGDRPLDPPEHDECETCDGLGVIADLNTLEHEPCPDCQYDSDPGEPDTD